MQESLYQASDARDFIRQLMQETLYQTADAEVSISDSGGKSLYIRELVQEAIYNI